MKFKKVLYSWFGYTRSERLGSLVLVVIVSVIIVLRLFDNRDYQSAMPEQAVADTLPAAKDSACRPALFFFDPNTLSADSLVLLGLSEKQARTLLNYRGSGARFRTPEDFRKVYGIGRQLQDSLVPYILIPESFSRDKRVPASRPVEMTVKQAVVRRDSSTCFTGESEVFIPVEINSADSVMLMTIPGIGKVLGPRVVKYRSLLGGFCSAWQLSEVYGIDSARVEDLMIYLSVDTGLLHPLDLNSASYGELIRHPYLTEDNTKDIVRYRKVSGSFSSLNELVRNHILSMAELEKIRPYLILGDSINIGR